jgi:hypothetical protein
MALTAKSPRRWWSRLHFLIRLAGLTGFMAAGVGVALCFLKDSLNKVASADAFTSADRIQAWWDYVYTTVRGETGDPMNQWSVGLLVGGVCLVLLALLVELLAVLFLAAGRRSAFGLNVGLQVGLAVALLVGINLYSYGHHLRLDWTLNQEFTLRPDVQDKLRQLKGRTTIVVYQRHKTFGQLNDKPDAYDYAAERKVVEKVKDLVEQFREFGPQFRVHVLDVEEEGFDKKVKELTEDHKELKEAIDRAPENSIFFVADGKVQRLSFNEFYRLDKSASRAADDNRGNLVLLCQGEKSFADKILNIDEKRPKVGILAIHEVLTTQGPEDFGFAGLKKSLESRGFEVRDVILKKWSEFGPPEPAVYTYEESKFENLEEQLAELDANIKNFEEEMKQLTELKKLWTTASLDDLTKKYAKQLERSNVKKVTEAMRRNQIEAVIEPELAIREKTFLKQLREDRAEVSKEKAALTIDSMAEQRRMTDLKAKLDRSLADCDLLLIPRMTIRNLLFGDRIPSRLYRLDEAQVGAIKDFLKAGKPILACFGPTNEPAGDAMRMAQLGPPGPDEVEGMLGQLGIKFGRQTVLYNVESKSFAERRSGLLSGGVGVEVPPVEFEALPPTIRQLAKQDAGPHKANRIRSAMQVVSHSRGEKTLDLRVRYPRPVYFEPEKGQSLDYGPEFLITSAASWNEEQPFPTREHTPRFEPPKPDDPGKDTLDEKRRGPFPIGIAVKTQLPADWYADKTSKPATVRVAAIGNGSLFSGTDLSTAKEELLLNTCNWLLGRDDLLPHAQETGTGSSQRGGRALFLELVPRTEQVWTYPRVALDDKAKTVWRWGAWVYLPALFAFFGLAVMMVRRLR